MSANRINQRTDDGDRTRRTRRGFGWWFGHRHSFRFRLVAGMLAVLLPIVAVLALLLTAHQAKAAGRDRVVANEFSMDPEPLPAG